MKALLLLASLLVGCAQGSQTVVLDWRGTDEGYAMALAAADEWASVCGADIVVGKDNGGAPAWDADGWVFGWPGHAGDTRYDSDGRVDQVVVSHYEGEGDAIRHELGHALGIINHAPAGLMAAKREHDVALPVTQAECAMLPR